jgi:hypothetical protein
MKECVLDHFRQLADELAKRKVLNLAIQTDRGTVRGTYDPLFKTVKVGGLTVPESEIHVWMKAAYGCKVQKIKLIMEASNEAHD